MAASRLIPVKVRDIEMKVEVVPVFAAKATSSRAAKAARSVVEAFGRAQQVIAAAARSTAQMAEKAGSLARPDHMVVEFRPKLSSRGRVIMTRAAKGASLKVTHCYDFAACPSSVPSAAAMTMQLPDGASQELAVRSS